MKKVYIILVLTFTFNSACKAQFIVPLEEELSFAESIDNSEDDNAQIPENTYYKDVNNLLVPYEGTWMGNIGLSTLEVEIEKVTVTSYDIMSDELLLKYRVFNELAGDLANTLNLPDNAPEVVKGRYFDYQGNYQLRYIYNLDCGQHGTIYIKLRDNPNELSLFLVPQGDRDIDPSCTNPNQILPTTGIVLSKQ